jgi:hypothetical protein
MERFNLPKKTKKSKEGQVSAWRRAGGRGRRERREGGRQGRGNERRARQAAAATHLVSLGAAKQQQQQRRERERKEEKWPTHKCREQEGTLEKNKFKEKQRYEYS